MSQYAPPVRASSGAYAALYKVNPDTCVACDGRGQTKETRTITKRGPDGRGVITVALGSGCSECRGLGVVRSE